MAVATESFSIREYAGKMRGVDYDKCWPFEAERSGRSPLPPMPVRRFRWWVDELRAVRSLAEADCQIDSGKKSGAHVETDDALEDAMGGPAATGPAGEREASAEEKVRAPLSRAKQRMPKKRSIIELFAVAPPIRVAHEKDQRDLGGRRVNLQVVAPAAAANGDFGVGGGRDLFELRTKGKLGKDGGDMQKEKIGVKKKLKAKTKQMKKKKKHKVEIRAAKKENVSKLKMSSSTDLCKILKNRAYGKQVSKGQKRIVHKQTNPATIGNLLKKHIFRLLRTSKFVSSTQEVARMSPVNIGVGKWKRCASSKKRKKLENTNGLDVIEQYNHSTKHLNSSRKDLSLVDGRLPVELPHLETLCKIVSDVLVASSTLEKLDRVSPVTEGSHVNLNDKETSLNLNGKGVVITRTVESGETSSEILLNGCFPALTTENSSITKKHPIVQILDLNNPVKDYVDLNCISMEGSTLLPSQAQSADQNVVGPTKDLGLDSDSVTCQEQSFSLISDHMKSLHDHIGKTVSVLDKRNAVSMDSIDGIDGCIGLPEFHKIYHTPKDTVLSTGSSVNPKAIVEQSSILRPIWRDKSTEEGFIGLPLNSQGELIHLDQGARYGVCDVDKMPKPALNSLQNFPASSHFQPQSNHILMKGKFPFISSYQDDGDENWLFKHHPARKVFLSDFSSVELQNLEKMNHQKYGGKAQFSGCNPRQMEYFSSGYSDPIASESCFERMKLCSDRDLELGTRSAIRPTMRLMGKNVTVGTYTKEYHGCIDGKLFTDKQVANTSYPTITVYNKPIFKRWHEHECIVKAECRASKGIPLNTPEVPSNCCCILADKLTTNYRQLGFGSDWLLNDGNSSVSGDRGLHFDLIRSPVQCQSLANRASGFAVNCSPEAQFVDMEQQRRFLTSNSQNFCHHIQVNSSHCKQSQSVPYSIPSTSHSPYINQMSAQASRSQSIPKVSHWMQDSTNQHLRFLSYPTAAYQPCNIPANIGFPHVTPYPRPVVSLPSSSSRSSQTFGSFGPTCVVYPSSVTGLATHNFISSSTCYRDEIEAKDGMEINFSHVTSQDYSQRCRKRSASNDGKFIETDQTVKRSNVKLQRHAIRPGSVRRELLIREKDNLKASELNACVDRTVDDNLPAMNSEKDSVAVSGGFFPFKSGHTRLGPVKLSAGAKHILRPNGNLVQENCRPIYSTVPFNQGTSAGQDTNLQEKAAKIYRF